MRCFAVVQSPPFKFRFYEILCHRLNASVDAPSFGTGCRKYGGPFDNHRRQDRLKELARNEEVETEGKENGLKQKRPERRTTKRDSTRQERSVGPETTALTEGIGRHDTKQ
jgi:hypothetical protein